MRRDTKCSRLPYESRSCGRLPFGPHVYHRISDAGSVALDQTVERASRANPNPSHDVLSGLVKDARRARLESEATVPREEEYFDRVGQATSILQRTSSTGEQAG